MNTLNLTKTDKKLRRVNIVCLIIILLLILVPMVYVLLASFMSPDVLLSKGISLKPSDWSTEGYKRVFADKSILRGFINSFIYSLSFGVLNVAVTMMAAYPMSREDLLFKKGIYTFFIITMFFGGGLVPTYLLIKDLGMLDTIWALIIPGCFSVFNLFLAQVYIKSLPQEMIEAAKVDGANDFQIFAKVILPLSKSIMFVIFLYSFVGMWNSYFDAMIYIKSPELEPLQLVLRKILVQNQPNMNMIGSQTAMAELKKIAELIKYATIVVSSVPLIVMFPFFQKYFEKGISLGSVKG
ncbi:carbohydrate ABC transporter permease [Anaerococcus urinomassiliensis]|uniref:carbohydrate ABC transporter permease n=1 Tax=Anaerococcus urinomassiliensis TaxID=1745712 RepID=UPI00093E5B96|nr:carbohydrate ABC transporter permease [Anaerococcus urinomassiliensis]